MRRCQVYLFPPPVFQYKVFIGVPVSLGSEVLFHQLSFITFRWGWAGLFLVHYCTFPVAFFWHANPWADPTPSCAALDTLSFKAIHPFVDYRLPPSMGKLIWHELSRYISLTASICASYPVVWRKSSYRTLTDAIWASFWGFFFRKFFWDFIGGTLRSPGGLQ